jgi:type II restriction enzyme
MANSDFLRGNLNQHSVKNSISKGMDSAIDFAVANVIALLTAKYPNLTFIHETKMYLSDIVAMLALQYPEYASLFKYEMSTSYIKPDGGFLFAKNTRGERRLILVSEIKRQGTNDKRALEGLPKQAKGNAIERLGKNLVGIRAIFKNEGVLPFVCFGSGDDFKEGSSIRDRVITMNEFFPLNHIFVEKDHLPFEPVSMLFRHNDWTVDEMSKVLLDIATRAIEYRFS